MKFTDSLKITGSLLAIMLLIQVLNTITAGAISSFGIVPRTFSGLTHIPLAPWIHHSWPHFFANALPCAVLIFLTCQQGLKAFIFALCSIIVLAGMGVWLFALKGSHAGASLLVFGLFGYLLGSGLFKRQFKDMLIAVGVLIAYGGLFISLLGVQPHVSWASHFYGLLAGLISAWISANFLFKRSL